MTPPWRVWPRGLICFFTIFRPSIITLLTCGIARETVPRFPLSLPVIIKTVSPFLIFILARWRGFFSFCFVAILSLWVGARDCAPTVLEHFGRERDDLHEVSLTQFAGHWSKDTCTSWVVTGCNDDSG